VGEQVLSFAAPGRFTIIFHVGCFQIEATDGKAWTGRFFTPHGVVRTSVGTLGTVKAVAQDVLEELGVEIW